MEVWDCQLLLVFVQLVLLPRSRAFWVVSKGCGQKDPTEQASFVLGTCSFSLYGLLAQLLTQSFVLTQTMACAPSEAGLRAWNGTAIEGPTFRE